MYPPPPHPSYAMPPDYPGYGTYRPTPPLSPSPGAYGYYSPRHSAYTATPSPRASPRASGHGHARHASQDPSAFYSSPRAGADFYRQYSAYSTPPPPREYVSPTDRFHSYRGFTPADGMRSSYKRRSYGDGKRRSSRSQHIYNVVVDDDGYRYYDYYEPPPPYDGVRHTWREADFHDYDQVPVYEPDQTPRTRPRRASHSAPRPERPMPKPRPAATKPARKATEDDARKANIPPGYNYKNWDPTEEPIKLLGSVFDANSLGKWVYDWTVFRYQARTPMADMAGELWLLLIQLASKTKRAEETMSKIRKLENRDLVEEFLDSGDRIWTKFMKVLRRCEENMLKAQKREKRTGMGEESGVAFVDTIFGRDYELENTEKLMSNMRLWVLRFDANCEEIVQNPSA
ncbi:hypothetical protein BDY21DRAFT_334011 [Lineolata rhizophorae]|uniref:Vegetative cell wall protein gp1 n=1 Tax=Lineolata rhizophorae TaxID=578093 RepID=A0A6A6PAQ0_9PEZI|nr:hypothetical protein BDY21DRAFT_334011 [Lineolata rhizophorae]